MPASEKPEVYAAEEVKKGAGSAIILLTATCLEPPIYKE